MTEEQLRAWLQGLVDTWHQSNFTSTPVFYENADMPDESKVGNVWIDVTVRFTGGADVTLGTDPLGRDYGVLAVMVYTREGETTATADQIIGSLRGYLRAHRRTTGAFLKFPVRTSTPPMLGWHKAGLMAPFTCDVA